MYKLVAMDIDGTLLDSYGNISKENIEAIKKAKEQNIEVVLTSGRMPKAMLAIASEANANNYLICGNGAMIYDVNKEKIIYNNYLSKKKLLEIIKICEENSIYYNVYTNDVIVTKSLNYNLLYYQNENLKNPEEKRIKMYITEDIYNYVENYTGNDFLKITICDSDELVFKSIINKLKSIKQVDILEVSHMSKKMIKHGSQEIEIAYFYTEITNENANKWTAIEKLIEHLGIQKEEVVAIGDNINDEPMIRNAGLGVAMGNASPYIKSIAKKVVADNNSSGVAEAIKDILN
jgi:Cof subfamily protein (haloacid dehalogenase superfamily)